MNVQTDVDKELAHLEETAKAKRFARAYLRECCAGLATLHNGKDLPEGRLKELASLCTWAGHDAMQAAKQIVQDLAVRRLAEPLQVLQSGGVAGASVAHELSSLLLVRGAMNPLFHDQVHRAHADGPQEGYWAVSPNVVFVAHAECARYIADCLNFVRNHGEQLLAQLNSHHDEDGAPVARQ